MIFALATLLNRGDHDAHRLVRRAISGDRAAGRTLLRRLTPVIRARLLSLCGVRAGKVPVDDLVQDVWVALLENRGRLLLAYDPSRGASFDGYVGGVTTRVACNLRRVACAAKRGGASLTLVIDESSEPACSGPSPVDRAENRELVATLTEHLLKELPVRGQLVLAHLFGDGRSPQQTAHAMGVNVQVVYNWQHRIRKLARLHLEALSLDVLSEPRSTSVEA